MARKAGKVQVQAVCQFCYRGGVTGEHLLAKWMHPLLPLGSTTHAYRGGHIHRGPASTSILLHKEGSHRGPLRNREIRRFCRACNNGWMNTIEGEAKSFLTKLIRGEPITLDAGAQDAIANWMTLKMICGQYYKTPERRAIAPEAQFAFYKDPKPLPDSWIWIGRSLGLGWRSGISHQTYELGRSQNPPVFPTVPNTQTMTLGLGQLVILGATTSQPGRLNEFAGYADHVTAPVMFRIWPRVSASIRWPSTTVLADRDVWRVSRLITEVLGTR